MTNDTGNSNTLPADHLWSMNRLYVQAGCITYSYIIVSISKLAEPNLNDSVWVVVWMQGR